MGIEEHRGPHVNDVERFDHMLPLALWISGHTGDIFEIDLPDSHGGWPLPGPMGALAPLGDALMAFEKTINGLARWNGQLKELQQGIALEVRVDRCLPGHAAQAFWGLIANGEHQLDHPRMGWRGWGLAGARATLQDLLQALA